MTTLWGEGTGRWELLGWAPVRAACGLPPVAARLEAMAARGPDWGAAAVAAMTRAPPGLDSLLFAGLAFVGVAPWGMGCIWGGNLAVDVQTGMRSRRVGVAGLGT